MYVYIDIYIRRDIEFFLLIIIDLKYRLLILFKVIFTLPKYIIL